MSERVRSQTARQPVGLLESSRQADLWKSLKCNMFLGKFLTRVKWKTWIVWYPTFISYALFFTEDRQSSNKIEKNSFTNYIKNKTVEVSILVIELEVLRRWNSDKINTRSGIVSHLIDRILGPTEPQSLHGCRSYSDISLGHSLPKPRLTTSIFKCCVPKNQRFLKSIHNSSRRARSRYQKGQQLGKNSQIYKSPNCFW